MWRAVGEKDAFLQITLSWNVITVKGVSIFWIAQKSNTRNDYFFIFLSLFPFSFFYFLSFPNDHSHFFASK